MTNDNAAGTTVVYQLSRKDLEDIVEKVVRRVTDHLRQEQGRGTELATLSRDETARILKVSLTTLYNLEKRGDLMPVRIGAKVLYRRSDIDEYFKMQHR